MKNTFFLLILLCSSAQAGFSQEQREILELQRQVGEAINKIDVDTVVSHMSDDFFFVNIPGSTTEGKEGVRKYFSKMLLAKDAYLKSATFEMTPEGVPLIYDGNFAVMHGKAVNHYVFSAGGSLNLPTYWSFSAVKKEGAWKMVSMHISGNTFDNPILDKLYALFAAVLILAIISFGGMGFFWGWKKRRKP